MASQKWILGRRTFLRGIAAGSVTSAVGLPTLECMLDDHGEVFAQDGSPIPKRYGVFFWGNGLRPDRWIPNRVGAQWWSDPNEELLAIAEDPNIRDRVSVFSDFRVLDDRGKAHHKTFAQVMTGTLNPNAVNGQGRPNGPSSDWIVRKAWAGQAAQRDALDVGVSAARKNSGLGINSGPVHDDSGRRPTIQMDPLVVFNSLFGGNPPPVGDGTTAGFVNARLRIVDMVRADAQRLRSRLGANDRNRLSDHLDHLAGVERRIRALNTQSSCQGPRLNAEAESAYVGTRTRLIDGSTLTAEDLTEKNAVMAELVALALACDLTRVFTFQHHGMQTDPVFWNLPSVTLGHHQSTHDDRGGSPNPQARDFEAVHEIGTYVMTQFSVLLKELARLPEGDGDLLDNTAIYATSEYGDASTHSTTKLIALAAGGGPLKGGHHISGGRERNIVDIPYTLMKDVLGLDIDGFGSGVSRATTTISEMLV